MRSDASHLSIRDRATTATPAPPTVPLAPLVRPASPAPSAASPPRTTAMSAPLAPPRHDHRRRSTNEAWTGRPGVTAGDRQMIWSLVRKPGGFARYVYREEMFPSVVFRRAYDGLQTPHHGLKGDLEYLRILHLAASTIEADVEAALRLLLTEGKAISADAVKLLASASGIIEVPELTSPQPTHRPNCPSNASPLLQGVAGRAAPSRPRFHSVIAFSDAIATKARVIRPGPSPSPTQRSKSPRRTERKSAGRGGH